MPSAIGERGGAILSPDASPKSSSCAGLARQGPPTFWVGAHRGRGAFTRSRVGAPGAPSLPWQGTLRVLLPQDGHEVAFEVLADLRVSPCPVCPLPAHAFAWGLQAGTERRVGTLAGASLNLASVECHLTQTVCASLSPYQPFCSSHLRGGGGRERLWEEEEEMSPLPSLPAASLSFPAAPGVPKPGL